MPTISVNVHRATEPHVAAPLDLEQDLDRARRLARLLDSEFSLAGVRFGLDAIVGLVPAVGDAVMLFAGLYPIYVARRHGLGKWVERKMVANLVLDFLGGAIPFAGDAFDIAFKANLRNVKLLERAAMSSKRRKPE